MSRKKKKIYHPIVKVVGKRIRDVIKENDSLLQKNVAHDANGMDVENLRKYMRGQQEMKISTLYRISQAMNMSLSDLLKGSEEDLNKETE